MELDSGRTRSEEKVRSDTEIVARETYRNGWKIKDEKETSTWRGSSRGWSEGNERARVVGGSRGGGGG